jgi:hypothetical protein
MSVRTHLGEQASSLLSIDRPEACRPSEARGVTSIRIASLDLFGRVIRVNQFATFCCVFFERRPARGIFEKAGSA